MQMPKAIAGMLSRLHEQGFAAYLIGGCVRDALMGRIPHDFDIATNAAPEEIISIFGKNYCKAYGRAFGTVGVLFQGGYAEITTFRTEGDYLDSRHPGRVSFADTVEEDLARRDFTMNAMAYSPETGLLDQFGGRADMENRLLRCVGVPQVRFREDALRILRGLRFLSRYGFQAEPLTDAAMRAGAFRLQNISEERIFSELCEILMGDHAAQVLLRYPDILGIVIPEVLPCTGFVQYSRHHDFTVWGHIARAVGAAPKSLPVRLAMLFHDIAKPRCFTMDAEGGHFKGHPEESAKMADRILRRLKCPAKLRRQVCRLVEWHCNIPKTMAKTRKMRTVLSDEDILLLHAVFAADDHAKREIPEDSPRVRKAVKLYEECRTLGLCCRISELSVNGEDLLSAGVPQYRIGRVLRCLLDAVIMGKCRNEKPELLRYLKYNLKHTMPLSES